MESFSKLRLADEILPIDESMGFEGFKSWMISDSLKIVYDLMQRLKKYTDNFSIMENPDFGKCTDTIILRIDNAKEKLKKLDDPLYKDKCIAYFNLGLDKFQEAANLL